MSISWLAFGEPANHIDYARGDILWENTPDGTVGHARIMLPAGLWSHLLFFNQEQFLRSNTIPHPVYFPRAGFMDVDVHARDFLKLAGVIA